MDSVTRRRLVRLARRNHIYSLGLDHLLGLGAKPRHRPKRVDSPLFRDEIAQFVIFAETRYPNWQKKKIKSLARDRFDVSWRYVCQIMKSIDPDRRELIQTDLLLIVRTQFRKWHLCGNTHSTKTP